MTLKVGDITLSDPVMLAPMSGVSDRPFRKLVKQFGAGLIFSEMIASRSMIEHSGESFKMTEDIDQEYPIAVQLAGCDPDIMAQAAQMNVARGADIIDINFGCPVKKIVNKLAGSALMREEALAIDIMREVVKAVSVPVTVKMRLGWDHDSLNAPALAKAAQDVGIQMVTVHGRTRQQMYKGRADWAAVARVRDVLDRIPLIVNGDICSADDAHRAQAKSGADGVMIGRACQGRPWLIRQIADTLAGRDVLAEPSLKEKLEVMLSHYREILFFYGEHKGVPLARKHLSWYIEGLPNSAALRKDINSIQCPKEVEAKLIDFFTPHMNAEEQQAA
jgi:tRNA-dihydrouridine synthase B